MTTSPPTRLRSSTSEVVALSELDLPELAEFIAKQSGRDQESVDGHLRWFLLKNPARQEGQPLGFGLFSADGLVGGILCSPQAFHFEDERIVLMGSSSFYVAENYRGQGGRIFLQYSRLGARMPLFGTSANAQAAALWKAAGAAPIADSHGEFLGVLRWPPLAEEFVHRKYSNHLLASIARPVSNLVPWFRRLQIAPSRSNALRKLTSAEEVDALAIHDSPRKLTSIRDRNYIHWRYFSGRDSTAAAFAFRPRTSGHEVLITVNQRARGYRGQIRALNVLDVYPEVPSEVWPEIVSALTEQYKSLVDILVLRHQSECQGVLLRRLGFLWRPFDAPTGWLLSKAKLLSTSCAYFVPADGDGLI